MRCRRPLLVLSSLCSVGLLLGSGCTQETPGAVESPKDDKVAASQPASGDKAAKAPKEGEGVYFAMPNEGSKVTETFTVAMGVNGKKVAPAGTDVPNKGLGHHHVIIDGKPVPAGQPVPADATHIHFGKGQKETTLTLAPGKHTLTLQFADGAHVSYGPEWSKTINVDVQKGGKERSVSFGKPADGATVTSPVEMEFKVNGMGIIKAGETPNDKTGGHHHVIVDGSALPAGTVVPANETNIHYGKGQTEAKVELPKGKHTLTLQFGDANHASYGETLSKTISITVK